MKIGYVGSAVFLLMAGTNIPFAMQGSIRNITSMIFCSLMALYCFILGEKSR